MPRFKDENRIEDIMGCYLSVKGWPEFYPEVDVQEKVAELVERIEDQVARNPEQPRHHWFQNALEYAKEAQQLYRDGQVEAGRIFLRQAWERLDSGNRANRSKSSIIAGPEGKSA
jgi:hypothetical protein